MAMYRSPSLDAFAWQSPVKDKDLVTPPGSPAKGDRYIVGPSATGAWATHDDQITFYNGTDWIFLTMFEGMACWVEDENKVYAYDGGAWAALGGAGGGGLGYALTVVGGLIAAPVDEGFYYFGSRYSSALDSYSARQRMYCPKAGTIKAACIFWRAGTAGSGEDVSMYVRLNNSSDTLIATIGDTEGVKIFS